MADDAWYTANRKPPPPRKPSPGERIWEERVDHVTWSCELRFHGESYGWEAQILRDGDLVIGRRFLLRSGATDWADAERRCLEELR